MKENKIVAVKELIDNPELCCVTYDINGIYKDALYQKNSEQLRSCVFRYLDFLYNRKQELKNQIVGEQLSKKLRDSVIIITIAFLFVYIVMTLTLFKSSYLWFTGYFLSLVLIVLAYMLIHYLEYPVSNTLERLYTKNENDLLTMQNIWNSSKENVAILTQNSANSKREVLNEN